MDKTEWLLDSVFPANLRGLERFHISEVATLAALSRKGEYVLPDLATSD